MKSLRDEMEIVNAYELMGTYRGAAALCGTTAKTVKRVLERRAVDQVGRRPAPPRVRNTAAVTQLIADRIRATDGRISAKRLLLVARKSGYGGSPRNFRRAVARLPSMGPQAAWRFHAELPASVARCSITAPAHSMSMQVAANSRGAQGLASGLARNHPQELRLTAALDNRFGLHADDRQAGIFDETAAVRWRVADEVHRCAEPVGFYDARVVVAGALAARPA
jgi:hypothetical protein